MHGYKFFRPVAMTAGALGFGTNLWLSSSHIHFSYANHELSDSKLLSINSIQFTAFFKLQR